MHRTVIQSPVFVCDSKQANQEVLMSKMDRRTDGQMDTLKKDYDCDFKVMVKSTWIQHNLNETPQLCVLKNGFLFPSLMDRKTTRKNEFDIKMVLCKRNRLQKL